MRYFEVNNSDNTVVNVIIWDGVSPYNFPGTYLLPEVPGVGVGWYLENGEWVDPNAPEEEELTDGND